MRKVRKAGPLAIVLGARGIELVRALRMADAPCGVMTGSGDPARWSRHVRTVLDWDWIQPLDRHDLALARWLVRFGNTQDQPPVLAYCSDQPMVFVSRYRTLLAEAFRFVVPDADLVEALVDKARFAALAREHRLPVPPTCVLPTGPAAPPADIDRLTFPIIVKPTVRDVTWVHAVQGNAKAVRVTTQEQLVRLWPRIRTLSGPAIAQQCVEGPETSVLSYHVYVDRDGLVVGEFTGRKIRTLPAEYGHTSALAITDAPDVLGLGRKIVHELDLRGVAKLDFKQDADGALHLLEINARFTLWAHPGARAGVNLPGLVYADLTGRPRPPASPICPDVEWVHPKDLVAARRDGMPLRAWLRWASTRPAKAVWSWEDPLPLAGMATARLAQAIRSRPGAVPSQAPTAAE